MTYAKGREDITKNKQLRDLGLLTDCRLNVNKAGATEGKGDV
jgi:hypothetical protein